MATEQTDEEAQQEKPLLSPEASGDDNGQQTLMQKAINLTCECTANLVKLLPTGSVLAFRLLSPLFTNQGLCEPVNQVMTAILMAICGLSSIILSFSDSFLDSDGTVHYGFATFKGLWVIDATAALPQDVAATYKIKFIDFIHGFMSLLVFASIALFDQNVVSCFFSIASEEVKQVLVTLPLGIGVLSSALFATFPTTRHGIGSPVSAA